MWLKMAEDPWDCMYITGGEKRPSKVGPGPSFESESELLLAPAALGACLVIGAAEVTEAVGLGLKFLEELVF